MPAIGGIGGGGGTHLEMGSGALVPYQLIPAGERNPFDQPQPGPKRHPHPRHFGHDERRAHPVGGRHHRQASVGSPAMARSWAAAPGGNHQLSHLGSTPAILGAALAASATAALGLTLLASVRRRRRDLALLKSLGFTRSQQGCDGGVESTVAVILGVVAGVPLGIAVGRYLWIFSLERSMLYPPPTSRLRRSCLSPSGARAGQLVAAAPRARRRTGSDGAPVRAE